MMTVDVIDDISALIRIIEQLPILILMGCILLISLLLRD